MQRGLQGQYKTISTVGESVKAFIPKPLPPQPPIEWTSELRDKFDQAHLALGGWTAYQSFFQILLFFCICMFEKRRYSPR